jgi:hypothetical protein
MLSVLCGQVEDNAFGIHNILTGLAVPKPVSGVVGEEFRDRLRCGRLERAESENENSKAVKT